MRQECITQIFNPNAFFLFLLTGTTWYYDAIYILFTYFASFTWRWYFWVIYNLHVQRCKFCGNSSFLNDSPWEYTGDKSPQLKLNKYIANPVRILKNPLSLLTFRKYQSLVLVIVRQKGFLRSCSLNPPKKVFPISWKGNYTVYKFWNGNQTNHASSMAAH